MDHKLINQILKEEILKEVEKEDYKGCLMLNLKNKISNWDDIIKIIDPKDVYIDPEDDTYGKETEPHITIIYGLKNDVPVSDLKEITNKLEDNIKLTIKNISLFENEKYDVVKFGIESDDLQKLNKLVKKLPNKSTFPTYEPHMTISYVKSGKGKKYIKSFKPQEIEGNTFVYSKNRGSKSSWKI